MLFSGSHVVCSNARAKLGLVSEKGLPCKLELVRGRYGKLGSSVCLGLGKVTV